MTICKKNHIRTRIRTRVRIRIKTRIKTRMMTHIKSRMNTHGKTRPWNGAGGVISSDGLATNKNKTYRPSYDVAGPRWMNRNCQHNARDLLLCANRITCIHCIRCQSYFNYRGHLMDSGASVLQWQDGSKQKDL